MRSLKQLDNPMLSELVAGNIFFFLLGEILIFVSFIFIGFEWKLATGYFIGAIISVGMVIHMAYAIDDSVRLNEEMALKHTRKTYAFRMLVIVAVFFIVWYFNFGNPGAVLLGMMDLKFSAYSQPITHRLTSKFLSKGR